MAWNEAPVWTREEEKVGLNHETETSPPPPFRAVSEIRRGLPQYLASVIKNLLLVTLGMVIAFPTIVIPPLVNSTEGLHFNSGQASWFGSLVYFCQPLGSLVAGSTLDSLGRKRSMIFLNIPFIVCWVALYFADSVTLLFVLCAIMGLGIGSIEAAILTYVGEISEPRLRGTLTSFAQIAEYMGFVIMFFLGTVTDWRTSALISAVVPIITMACLTQVPETPIWLISRQRSEDAVKSLQWLRGCVKPHHVQGEFEDIVRYSKACKVPPRMLKKLLNERLEKISYSDSVAITLTGDNDLNSQELEDIPSRDATVLPSKLGIKDKTDVKLDIDNNIHEVKYKPSQDVKVPVKEKLIDFFRPEMMKPMFLVCSFFLFTYGSGIIAIRPYMVPIFMKLGIVMEPFLATTVFTAIGLGGCVICTLTLRFVGKRPLALVSIVGCGVSSILAGGYALHIDQGGQSVSWVPVVIMVAWAFFTGVGMDPLPWMYLSEVFPFRGRSMACGVAAAISYIFGFIATKTVLMLEDALTLAGVFFVYAGFNIVGTIYFYFYLPETEGMSMEAIEERYKTKTNKIKNQAK